MDPRVVNAGGRPNAATTEDLGDDPENESGGYNVPTDAGPSDLQGVEPWTWGIQFLHFEEFGAVSKKGLKYSGMGTLNQASGLSTLNWASDLGVQNYPFTFKPPRDRHTPARYDDYGPKEFSDFLTTWSDAELASITSEVRVGTSENPWRDLINAHLQTAGEENVLFPIPNIDKDVVNTQSSFADGRCYGPQVQGVVGRSSGKGEWGRVGREAGAMVRMFERGAARYTRLTVSQK
jgi:hypothetical protein